MCKLLNNANVQFVAMESQDTLVEGSTLLRANSSPSGPAMDADCLEERQREIEALLGSMFFIFKCAS